MASSSFPPLSNKSPPKLSSAPTAWEGVRSVCTAVLGADDASIAPFRTAGTRRTSTDVFFGTKNVSSRYTSFVCALLTSRSVSVLDASPLFSAMVFFKSDTLMNPPSNAIDEKFSADLNL
eukprot:scaffold64_cov338-Pavlova_lutheri.AAC.96